MQSFFNNSIDEKLSNLNSFLENMSNNNSGANCYCFYSIQRIQAKNSIDETIQNEFQSFFEWMIENKKIKNQSNLRVTYEKIDDFSQTLSQEINHWFFQMEFSPKYDEHERGSLKHHFLNSFNKIFTSEVNAWRVLDGSYDIEYTDLVIEDHRNYYLLHFGWCD
ncbi:hypothetical protein [Acinetobacter stercoris]|uniref:Uncharacterized protein n=1 Tax=Acinetobacter stercoris TaxID=2126983 RepID=A0A2U3N183_9GAMM|nr:hypothetical protein [Acinetobacter stercoris]SPL71375.1 hypothetical protein KPC_2553 [Acinetobacter stercoris]